MTDHTQAEGAQCPPAAMFDVSWSTTGLANTFTEGGRFTWKTKMRNGWWPVVWGWSFQGSLIGDEAAVSPLLGVSFIQAQDPTPTVPGVNMICNWQIFFDLIPTLAAFPVPATPTAVNTNFGGGWIVPAKDGLPMDLLAVINKNPDPAAPIDFPYSGCFNFIWNYQPLDRLR